MRLTQGNPPALVLNDVVDTIKPYRYGEPETGRVQRVADSRGVLMTQGQRSLVTEWRIKPWRSGRRLSRRIFQAETPPWRTDGNLNI
jgi:hypothetical protein